MKNQKTTAKVTENTTDRTNEAGAMPQPAMTGEQIKALTQEYVAKLNKVGETEATAWVETGRLVEEFLKKLAADGQSKKNLYKALADHPESAYQEQQLRNYHQSYTIYQDLGGKEGAPSLPMTFYIAVCPKRLTITKKLALLKRAQAENLSVSELKGIVAVAGLKEKACASPKKTTLEEELKKFDVQAQAFYASLTSLHTEALNATKPTEAQYSIRKSLEAILDYADAYLSTSELRHLPSDTDDHAKPAPQTPEPCMDDAA